MAHIAGRGRYARETYPEPKLSAGAGSVVFYDAMTDTSGTTSTIFVPMLRVNAGAALGFDVPAQPTGSKLLVSLAGCVAQNALGNGDTGYVRMTVNGVATADPIQSVDLNGTKAQGFAALYRVALGAGVTQIRFEWRCRFGGSVQCNVTDADNPSWLAVTGVVGQ